MTIDLTTLSEYLSIRKGIIISWVNNDRIPYKKRGKRLTFNQNDIEKWIEKSRIKAMRQNSVGVI